VPPGAGEHEQAQLLGARPGRGEGREGPGPVKRLPASIGEDQFVALRCAQLIHVERPEAPPTVGANAGDGAPIQLEQRSCVERREERDLQQETFVADGRKYVTNSGLALVSVRISPKRAARQEAARGERSRELEEITSIHRVPSPTAATVG
jgi:hypothetical protein